MDFEEYSRRLDEAKKQRHACPECGEPAFREDDCEQTASFTTYWGEGEPVEWECRNCLATVLVEEHVTREWNVTSPGSGE